MAKNMTILVVDDMEINRIILKELFQQECVILEAENGQVALDLLAEHPETDIVIMDIVMPVMDGFEALRSIRANPQFSGLPVVICTEHADVDTQVRTLDLGSTDFITKPFNARVVLHRIRNLIELRKMEREIAEQQRANQLRDILSSIVSPLGLIEFTDNKMRAIYLNQGFFDMFSVPPEELQHYFTDMLPSLVPEDAEQLAELFRQNQEDGSPVDMIYRVPQKEGTVSMYEMHALSIRYEHFENPVYLASITDITHQRRTEVALRDTDQRLKALINAIPGGILTLDLSNSYQMTYFNDTACNLLGMSRSEFQVMSQDLTCFVYEEDVPMVKSVFRHFIDERAPFSETFRVVTKNQELRWVCLSGAPIITPEGALLCNCVCLDVSAEKESELKLEQAFKEMRYRSEHDALTGAWNRETFNQKTREYLLDAPETPHVLLAMNIQRFKVINELFGASVGDEVLRMLSRALEQMFGDIGTYGRMEADHFMACFPLANLDMENTVQVLDKALKMQYSDYRIELFYGIYEIHDTQVSVDQMCDRATMALKTVKGSAVKRFAFYDDAMRKNLLEEQAIIEEMHEALEKGQFVPYFQPIMGLDSLRPVSAEVLVRWKHPVKGLIPPGIFVPLFERNGFISQLDFYIWEQACKYLHKWKTEGSMLVPLSINISRIDLYQPHLCESLLGLLEKYDIDSSLLKLEITESAYIDDLDVLPTVLKRLRAAGFQILMDDFGSGYSSLNTLKDMPINIMKIDMCFLEQLEGSPRAASILTSVVRMAKWLDLPCVAEGIETKEQLNFLHSIGCGMGQGYYFSKPLPSDEFETLLANVPPLITAPQASVSSSIDLDLLWTSSTEVNSLFNSMIGGMAVFEMVDDELKAQRVNDAFYHVVGCTPQEVFNTEGTALSYLHPEDRQHLIDACQKATVSHQVEIVDTRRIRNDGESCWLEYRIRHLSSSNDYASFFFIVSDITPQKELELSQSVGQYPQILRNVFTRIYEVNFTKGQCTEIYVGDGSPSESVCSLQDAYERHSQGIHPEDLEMFQKTYQTEFLRQYSRDSAGRRVCTFDFRQKNGSGVYEAVSRTFIRLDDFEYEDVYLLCLSNPASRSQAEITRELQLQTKELLLVERQYRKVFLADMLFVFDIEPENERYDLLHQSEDAEEKFYPYTHYLHLEESYFHPDDFAEIQKRSSLEHIRHLASAKISEDKVCIRIRNRMDEWVMVEATIHLMERRKSAPLRFVMYLKVMDSQNHVDSEWRIRAEIDSMSLLYNRGAVQERIINRLSDPTHDNSHAFFLLDIDDFKHVNDTLGHAVGDEVIQSIATVLRNQFRATDLVGRLGGDEFIMFISFQPDEENSTVHKKAQSMLSAIEKLSFPAHPALSLTVSLGVAIAPDDGCCFEELYNKADKALYSIKLQGKNNYALYQNLSDSAKQ